MTAKATSVPARPFPAKFHALQPSIPGRKPLELWTLTEPMGIHPVDSTVARETLEHMGYMVPRPPKRENGPR